VICVESYKYVYRDALRVVLSTGLRDCSLCDTRVPDLGSGVVTWLRPAIPRSQSLIPGSSRYFPLSTPPRLD